MNPQAAVNIIKEHVEQAMDAGYDYDCKVTQVERNGAFTLQIRDLDEDSVEQFVVIVTAKEQS